ncbi:hypothetical protein VUR80DRAFT_6489 [Thermomyces stellatus]
MESHLARLTIRGIWILSNPYHTTTLPNMGITSVTLTEPLRCTLRVTLLHLCAILASRLPFALHDPQQPRVDPLPIRLTLPLHNPGQEPGARNNRLLHHLSRPNLTPLHLPDFPNRLHDDAQRAPHPDEDAPLEIHYLRRAVDVRVPEPCGKRAHPIDDLVGLRLLRCGWRAGAGGRRWGDGGGGQGLKGDEMGVAFDESMVVLEGGDGFVGRDGGGEERGELDGCRGVEDRFGRVSRCEKRDFGGRVLS